VKKISVEAIYINGRAECSFPLQHLDVVAPNEIGFFFLSLVHVQCDRMKKEL
jgi:hypothetical protein